MCLPRKIQPSLFIKNNHWIISNHKCTLVQLSCGYKQQWMMMQQKMNRRHVKHQKLMWWRKLKGCVFCFATPNNACSAVIVQDNKQWYINLKLKQLNFKDEESIPHTTNRLTKQLLPKFFHDLLYKCSNFSRTNSEYIHSGSTAVPLLLLLECLHPGIQVGDVIVDYPQVL